MQKMGDLRSSDGTITGSFGAKYHGLQGWGQTCSENVVPADTKTILVVDDEPSVRNLVSMILRQSGYRVLEAADSESATQIHGDHRGEIDLLLTDVGLPGENGCALAAALY